MNFKTCNKCNKLKLLSDFSNDKYYLSGKVNRCKECERDRRKRNYNSAVEVKKSIKIIEGKRKYVCDYLSEKSCVDCNNNDILVLEFDHVRGKKYKMISQMIKSTSLDKIKIEIEKCDVVCSNCHSRRTEIRQKGYRYLYSRTVNRKNHAVAP